MAESPEPNVSLREYFEARLEEMDKRYSQAHAAQHDAVQAALVAVEKATIKADTATEKRFESVNEFRAQLGEQASRLITRAEVEAHLLSLNEKLSDLRLIVQASAGRSAGLAQGWAWIVGAIAMAGAIVGIIIGTR